MKTKIFLYITILFLFSITSCNSIKKNHNSNLGKDISDFSKDSGYFIDKRDGKKYKWVKIGEQVWMAENLAFKVDSGCVAFKHKENKVKKYGYYYSWESAKKSCPEGWHLPTEEDIKGLSLKDGISPYDVFDSLRKNKDYGLNLCRTGYYNVEDNQFALYYKFPYLGESHFWTGYYKTNKSERNGNAIYFYKQFFWRKAGVAFSFSKHYYPVRCVKD